MSRKILTEAVAAVRAYQEIGPDLPRAEAEQRTAQASAAVTRAVVEGEILHTQIAQMAGCTGLRVIELIADWSAQARAIGVERNWISNYEGQLRAAAGVHALRRVADEGHGAITQIAREVGVNRPVVYDWMDRVEPDWRSHLSAA